MLSEDDWNELIGGLPEQPAGRLARSHTRWGDGKRLLASVWIWVSLTHGVHIYARPLVPTPLAAGQADNGAGPPRTDSNSTRPRRHRS